MIDRRTLIGRWAKDADKIRSYAIVHFVQGSPPRQSYSTALVRRCRQEILDTTLAVPLSPHHVLLPLVSLLCLVETSDE